MLRFWPALVLILITGCRGARSHLDKGAFCTEPFVENVAGDRRCLHVIDGGTKECTCPTLEVP